MALQSIGVDEIRSLIENDNVINMTCDWCGVEYVFGQEECLKIINEIKT